MAMTVVTLKDEEKKIFNRMVIIFMEVLFVRKTLFNGRKSLLIQDEPQVKGPLCKPLNHHTSVLN